MATLLSLKTLVRSILDETTAAQWTDANLVRWINAAERDIAIKTGCIETILSLTTTAESRLVAFTGNFVNYVEYAPSGTTEFLPGSKIVWQDTDDATWTDTSDAEWVDTEDILWLATPSTLFQHITPQHLGHIKLHEIITPQYWFQWGNNIVIEPRPTVEYDLNVYVSGYPSDQMSTDANEPQIPTEFQKAIPYYAAMMAEFQAKRYTEFAFHYNLYISTIQTLMDSYIIRYPTCMSDIHVPLITIARKPREVRR